MGYMTGRILLGIYLVNISARMVVRINPHILTSVERVLRVNCESGGLA